MRRSERSCTHCKSTAAATCCPPTYRPPTAPPGRTSRTTPSVCSASCPRTAATTVIATKAWPLVMACMQSSDHQKVAIVCRSTSQNATQPQVHVLPFSAPPRPLSPRLYLSPWLRRAPSATTRSLLCWPPSWLRYARLLWPRNQCGTANLRPRLPTPYVHSEPLRLLAAACSFQFYVLPRFYVGGEKAWLCGRELAPKWCD